MTGIVRTCGLGLASVLLFAACSRGGDNPIVSQSSTATAGKAAVPAATATAGATMGPATTATSTQAAVRKVSANNASKTELQQAFEAAGISNAARWAGEVEEYRPYPNDDPNFTKLRRELAKYNPGPGVVDQIVATLALP